MTTRLLAYLTFAVLPATAPAGPNPVSDSTLVNDVSRLNPVEVKTIRHPRNLREIQEAVATARERGLRISIAGRRHSQGGHIAADGVLLLDMTGYNRVLEVDREDSTVTVQSGATWADVQEALNPHGFAVEVMQSSNIFTVGGSLSCNAHGRDPRYGPMVDSVRSFRLLTAAGEVLNVSRTENEELFRLVLGGYGLFGVILDADLEVTANVTYEREVVSMDYRDYPGYFESSIRGDPSIGLHSARLSIVPGREFLRELYARVYRRIGKPGLADTLVRESNVSRDRLIFGLSRRFRWGKAARWFLQTHVTDVPGRVEIVSRNNAMRPPIAFLAYESPYDTDILQEYFVPLGEFVPFVDGMRAIVEEEGINLLHVAVRYVRKNEEVVLSYAPEDMFSLVLYMNIGLDEASVGHARGWTRRLVDLALEHRGRHYLVYQGFPTREQTYRAYPSLESAFRLKEHYDPELRFMNRFYERYGPAGGGR